LLALDLDGTLVREDGVVAPEDRAAIVAARAQGIVVTFATGRLSSGTVPLARELGIDQPLVCGDGAATVSPHTAELLAVTPLPGPALQRLLAQAMPQGLACFFFSPHTVFAPSASEEMSAVVGWPAHLLDGPALGDVLLGGPALPVVAAFAVGEEAPVRTLAAACEAPPLEADTSLFPLAASGLWAVRLSPAGTSKAAGLARVAALLGVTREEIAVVGDWYNDVSMFRWAAWSYAMGHAPEPVQQAARHTLRATARTGGGVAEALAHILQNTTTSRGQHVGESPE
jgi:Cof subfamily protein (haloacid dehalogenase superfamily)